MKRIPAPEEGLAIAALLLFVSLCAAQIPQKMNYQVMLTDDADQPLSNQTVQMVFEIWDAGVSFTPLWTEARTCTTSSIGVVSVILGAVNPIDIDFDIPLWLEVEVDGEVLSPRREIVGAPYALTDEAGGAGDGHSLDADDGSPVDALYVDADGNVSIGEEGEEGALAIGGDDQYSGAASLVSTSVGGGLWLKDHAGGMKAAFEAGDYGSAYLAIWSPGEPSSSVYLTGNGNSSGEPWLWIEGSSRSAIFKMDLGGDESVQLPTGSVSSPEVRDEPGVASVQTGNWYPLPYNTTVNVDSRQIIVPEDGFVFALATAQLELDNSIVQRHAASFGISQSSGAFSPYAQEALVKVLDGMPAGVLSSRVAVQGLFAVSAGANNFYFLAHRSDGLCAVLDRQFTLMYFPTSYGIVDVTDEPAGPARSH